MGCEITVKQNEVKTQNNKTLRRIGEMSALEPYNPHNPEPSVAQGTRQYPIKYQDQHMGADN